LRDFTPKLSPTLEKLLHTATAASDDDNQRDLEEAIHVTAQQIHEARCDEEAAVNMLLQEWCAGAVGYVPSEKPEECIRVGGPAQVPIIKSPRSQKECVNSNYFENIKTSDSKLLTFCDGY
jgi:hypothetical protein